MNKNSLSKFDVITDKIIKARFKEFLEVPNVVGLAVGRKIQKFKQTAKPCLTFFVAKKVEKKYLPKEYLLPQSLEENGSEVLSDVIETGPFYALDVNIFRERPARPGVSIGHYNISAGTFGAIVTDNLTSNEVILSNNHVLADCNNAKKGDAILQPGSHDGGTIAKDTIGKLLRFKDINFSGGINYVDAAICSVNNPADILNNPHDNIPAPSKENPAVGLLFAGSSTKTIMNPIIRALKELNISLPSGSTINGSIDMTVQKTGRTTGGTTGTITNIGATVNIGYGTAGVATFSDQIITGDMSDPGDSGSMVVRGGAGAPDDCAGTAAISSLINQDLTLDRFVAGQFRDEILRASVGGQRVILLYRTIEERIAQVIEALTSKNKEIAERIVKHLLPTARKTFVDPTDPDLKLHKNHINDLEKLYTATYNELLQREIMFFKQIIQLTKEVVGKKPSEILELLEDPEFTIRIPTGLQYLGNINQMEVHDLDKLTNNCQITEIIDASHAVFFETDSLRSIQNMGFDNCHYCIGKSKR